MSAFIYDTILKNAPGATPVSGGALHEEIWLALLRVEDPGVHNVKLRRGDGGIDGIAFLDPVVGTARVYQSKFFVDLSDKERRAAVVESFCAAHAHGYVCEEWTLLLPVELSAPELSWLMSEMKTGANHRIAEIRSAEQRSMNAKKSGTKAAATVGKKRKKSPSLRRAPGVTLDDVIKRIADCAVRYRDSRDMEDMLRRNLSIAGRYLPDSTLALANQLKEERDRLSVRDRELGHTLEVLKQQAIRDRSLDARRAVASIRLLAQGWGTFYNFLSLPGDAVVLAFAHRLEQSQGGVNLNDPDALRRVLLLLAQELESFVDSKAHLALESEGLVIGLSEAVSNVKIEARWLAQVCELESLGMADAQAKREHAKRARSAVQEVQQLIAQWQRRALAGTGD